MQIYSNILNISSYNIKNVHVMATVVVVFYVGLRLCSSFIVMAHPQCISHDFQDPG